MQIERKQLLNGLKIAERVRSSVSGQLFPYIWFDGHYATTFNGQTVGWRFPCKLPLNGGIDSAVFNKFCATNKYRLVHLTPEHSNSMLKVKLGYMQLRMDVKPLTDKPLQPDYKREGAMLLMDVNLTKAFRMCSLSLLRETFASAAVRGVHVAFEDDVVLVYSTDRTAISQARLAGVSAEKAGHYILPESFVKAILALGSGKLYLQDKSALFVSPIGELTTQLLKEGKEEELPIVKMVEDSFKEVEAYIDLTDKLKAGLLSVDSSIHQQEARLSIQHNEEVLKVSDMKQPPTAKFSMKTPLKYLTKGILKLELEGVPIHRITKILAFTSKLYFTKEGILIFSSPSGRYRYLIKGRIRNDKDIPF